MPRTSTTQWQDLGNIKCDATQVPMIQKMQKTVEILQVQLIDKVVEISEIMQNKDKCQRSRKNGNSRKFTDRIVDVPIARKRQCQPNAQVIDQIPTTNAKDAKMQKRSERQSTSESDGKCKDKIQEKESWTTVPDVRKHDWEREQESSTRRVDRTICAHMSESKRASWPPSTKPNQRHEKSNCKSERTQKKPHPKERLISKIQDRGNWPPACMK